MAPRRRVRLGAVAVACVVGCASPPEGPTLAVPAAPVAVEARFGDSYCRRIEDPRALDDLVAFAISVRTGWQATWREPPPPSIVVEYSAPQEDSLRLGVGDGQLFTRFDGRAHFRPFDESSAADLIRRLGGPPIGAPDIPCRPAGG